MIFALLYVMLRRLARHMYGQVICGLELDQV